MRDCVLSAPDTTFDLLIVRGHTRVLDDRTAYLVAPEPEALGAAAHRKLSSFYLMMESKATGTSA